MSQTNLDVIDEILGEALNDSVVALRSVKPELATQMQDYYNAIFLPTADSERAFPATDRFLVAIRTAAHTGSSSVVSWYSARAAAAGVDEEQIERTKNILERWPISDRLGTAMRHVDLITKHPVDSSQADIDALLTAGLTPAGVVVLSQVVAYVSYQLRLIAALRALGEF